jgi:hypothetical protein
VSYTLYTLRRVAVLSLAMLLTLGSSFATTVSAKDKTTPGTLSVPVSAAVTGISPATGQPLTAGRFQGTATITQFASSGGQLVAIGTLTGVVTDGDAVVDSIVSNFSAPVTSPSPAATGGAAAPAVAPVAATSCGILNLQIGPIHLDLLGLVLDTNQIVVNLTAVPGAGNLLGNLLCSVTNLLNGGLSNQLATIVNLLNQILAAL